MLSDDSSLHLQRHSSLSSVAVSAQNEFTDQCIPFASVTTVDSVAVRSACNEIAVQIRPGQKSIDTYCEITVYLQLDSATVLLPLVATQSARRQCTLLRSIHLLHRVAAQLPSTVVGPASGSDTVGPCLGCAAAEALRSSQVSSAGRLLAEEIAIDR